MCGFLLFGVFRFNMLVVVGGMPCSLVCLRWFSRRDAPLSLSLNICVVLGLVVEAGVTSVLYLWRFGEETVKCDGTGSLDRYFMLLQFSFISWFGIYVVIWT